MSKSKTLSRKEQATEASMDVSDMWLLFPTFAVPSVPGETDILIGFHLSLPMGYVDS